MGKKKGRGRDGGPRTQADGSRCMDSRPTSVQLLSTWTGDSAPSLLVVADAERLVFNAPEGWQRLCVEHGVKVARVSTLCVTDLSPAPPGGLPGYMLTGADAGLKSLRLCGPTGLQAVLASTRHFMRRDDLSVAVEEAAPPAAPLRLGAAGGDRLVSVEAVVIESDGDGGGDGAAVDGENARRERGSCGASSRPATPSPAAPAARVYGWRAASSTAGPCSSTSSCRATAGPRRFEVPAPEAADAGDWDAAVARGVLEAAANIAAARAATPPDALRDARDAELVFWERVGDPRSTATRRLGSPPVALMAPWPVLRFLADYGRAFGDLRGTYEPRYPSIPYVESGDDGDRRRLASVVLASDLMHVTFPQLAWAPTLLPALKLLYGEEEPAEPAA
ncbi:3'-tRNA processing endoribonuclease [Aureococcus anophagefferens]|nr:3'-tRNA processing endoribonuclease [Aureococcus anophagefferens]